MYINKKISKLTNAEMITYDVKGYRLCYVDYEEGKQYNEASGEWVPFDDWETTSHMRAYFTPLPLNQQSGDNWDVEPYEFNSGVPYDYEIANGVRLETSILVVHFTTPTHRGKGCTLTPQDYSNDTGITVDQINAGMFAWCFIESENGYRNGISIHAGTSVSGFVLKLAIGNDATA